MKKKLLAILMIATMVVGMFTGCGKKSANVTADGKPILRVAMEAAYAPFNWTQTTDANGAYPIAGTKEYANGYDVMVAKALCEQMGYELEIYKTDWDSLILGLNSNKYDALICGMNIIESRKETVNFSKPYRTISNCIIVRKDNEKYADVTSIDDLAGCKALTQMNSNWEPLMDEISDVEKIPSVGTSNEIAAQVIAGKADIGIVDDPTASVMCMYNEDLKYIVFDQGKGFSTDGQESDSMGIAVRKSDEDLLNKINDAMDAIGLDRKSVV